MGDAEKRMTPSEAVEDLLVDAGFLHGLPLGAGDEEVTLAPRTRFRALYRMVDRDIQNMIAEEEGDSGQHRRPSRDPDDMMEPFGPSPWTQVNSWEMKSSWRGEVFTVTILKNQVTKEIKKKLVLVDELNRFACVLNTVLCRSSYSLIKAEMKARKLLFKRLTKSQKAMWELADTIMEEGKSGIIYFIRKNRPILATRLDPVLNEYKPVCALCVHPLGHYTGTWAGVMAPSDEALYQLLLIKADESRLWRYANQISLREYLSGV